MKGKLNVCGVENPHAATYNISTNNFVDHESAGETHGGRVLVCTRPTKDWRSTRSRKHRKQRGSGRPVQKANTEGQFVGITRRGGRKQPRVTGLEHSVCESSATSAEQHPEHAQAKRQLCVSVSLRTVMNRWVQPQRAASGDVICFQEVQYLCGAEHLLINVEINCRHKLCCKENKGSPSFYSYQVHPLCLPRFVLCRSRRSRK